MDYDQRALRLLIKSLTASGIQGGHFSWLFQWRFMVHHLSEKAGSVWGNLPKVRKRGGGMLSGKTLYCFFTFEASVNRITREHLLNCYTWATNSSRLPQTVCKIWGNFTVHGEWSLLGPKKFHCTAGQVQVFWHRSACLVKWSGQCGAGAPLFPPCPFTSSSFPPFYFSLSFIGF